MSLLREVTARSNYWRWQRPKKPLKWTNRYPQTIVRCKDGWYRVYAVSGREWRGLLQMMGNPAWGDDPCLASV